MTHASLHVFLQDQENLRAFQQLTAAPTGSVRKWEQLLGWKPGRVQRFLSNLKKEKLAEVVSCRQHSIFKPLVGVAECSEKVMCSVAPNQSTAGLTTKSDFGGPPPVELQEQTAELVALMNGILCKKHPMDYLPVNPASPFSQAAVRAWLTEFGIPFPDAVEILTARCQSFDQRKINGDMPRSLGFFTKSVKARWQKMQNRRQQLPLFPKMEMKVVPVQRYVPEPESPPATPEQIAAFRAEFERVANDPNATRMA